MSLTPQIHVRPIQPADVEPLYQKSRQWARVQWYATPGEERHLLQSQLGFLAEDSVGVRGFVVMAPQPANYGLWVGVGLRDGWHVGAFLKHLLPMVESAARQHGLQGLLHLDYGDWCGPALLSNGFQLSDWLVNYQQMTTVPPPLVLETAYIRQATSEDVDTILTIDRAVFPTRWHTTRQEVAYSFREPHGIMLAEMARQAVGYLWFERVDTWLHLSRVAVLPTHQGRGVGGQLLRHTMVTAIAQKVAKFTVNTLESNVASRKLYERFGFQTTGRRTPVLWKPLENQP